MAIPNSSALETDHYWLINAHVPIPLLTSHSAPETDDLAYVDLEVQQGQIVQIVPAEGQLTRDSPTVDLKRGQVWCCFVDMHTHLDKAHIWERSPNRHGTFNAALMAVQKDREYYWDVEDVYRRMEFSLKCSYANGTRVIRTHIDCLGEQAEISLGVFNALKAEWSDRLTLQAVSLVPLDYFLTSKGEILADQIVDAGGILGGLALMDNDLDANLDRVFALAAERNLNLDFHTDESGNPQDMTLRHIAEAILRHEFSGRVICGHCCSLAVQSPEEVMITLNLVKQARIGIVSLPMCNLYLQDRVEDRTPRWRGVTVLHELQQQGIPVAIASDNCRDPFYGYGNHDMLEVFTQGTRIAHLDTPYADWSRTVTTTPADLLGCPTAGRIGVGLPADLVLFKARYFSELLSRPQHDRIVLRNGYPIDTTLPDYAELDDLLG